MMVSKTVRSDRLYVGRFAPSPTGDLHFGSLVTAVGSFLQARTAGGQWLIRIEDIDPPREVTGASQRQLATLAAFGLISDRPVEYQSRRQAQHLDVLERLLQQGKAFPCACSRSELPASGIYPGTCRTGLPRGRVARAIRFRVDPGPVEFHDGIQGRQRHDPSRQCGDFVVRRADGHVAYQLAVVVDDAAAGVTEVVRGADLIESSGRQILLYEALNLPRPAYAHLPLVVDAEGRKLSKSERDDPIERFRPETALRLALRALGHEPPRGHATMSAQWDWAVRNWSLARVPVGPISISVQADDHDVYTPVVNAPTAL